MPDALSHLLSLARAVHDPAVAPAGRRGIASVCSAHPLVLEAALGRAARDGGWVLIEATCNQVNQEGGYTGMTPVDFRDLVWSIAGQVGCPRERIILGGDHLGPNPWRHLPADEAMACAGAMIEAYAAAGFVKLHLDASMGCAGEPPALADEIVAERAAALAARAEAVAPGQAVYIVGTEVPVPGGALEALDHLAPTAPQAARQTADVTHSVFARVLSEDVWQRVLALVVQPGVEFGAEDVVFYHPEKAVGLIGALDDLPGLAFEAHSTDYQTVAGLRRLVEDGFAILKVGPALTFAMREALYGLDAIADVLAPGETRLRAVMEAEMAADPSYWQAHYDAARAPFLRHYSYSDRIRYYWARPAARAAIEALFVRLAETGLPDPLLSQFLPRLYERVRLGHIPRHARSMVLAAIADVLDDYGQACVPEGAS